MWMIDEVSRGGHSRPLRNAGASRNAWTSPGNAAAAAGGKETATAKVKNATARVSVGCILLVKWKMSVESEVKKSVIVEDKGRFGI